MQTKFLKAIVEILINKQAIVIVDLLAEKKDVNEFIIAKKMDLTINQTRNILYKLSDYGLVSFIRKRDKRKGWYIYFWTLNVYQSLSLLEEKMQVNLNELNEQLNSRIKKPYYLCNTCSLEVTEEAALLNDFTCSECEQVYELANQSTNIIELEKEIKRIEKDLELIRFEKDIESGKLGKKKDRKIKKAEKDKQDQRKEKRAFNKQEKIQRIKREDKEKKKLERKEKKLKNSVSGKKKTNVQKEKKVKTDKIKSFKKSSKK